MRITVIRYRKWRFYTMINNDWQDLIKMTYWAIVENQKRFHRGRQQYLMVESLKGDGWIYRRLLRQPLMYKGETLPIDSKDIRIVDPESFCGVVGDKARTDGLKGSIPGVYFHPDKRNKKWIPQGVNIWKAIIDIIEYCLSQKETSSLFYFYGFIDRDTGRHKTKGLPISMTEMHDCETNILRMCLKDYFDELSHKDEAIDIISRILAFTYYQGILEQTSFKYDDSDSPIADQLKRITHMDLFSNDSERLIDMFYEEENAKDVFINYVNTPYTKPKDWDEYYYFKTDFKAALSKSFDAEELIHRWLSDEMVNGDEEKLNQVFQLSNGHLVLTLFLEELLIYLPPLNFKEDTSQKAKESMLMSNILDLVDNKTIKSLRTISPLTYYLKFLSLCYSSGK